MLVIAARNVTWHTMPDATARVLTARVGDVAVLAELAVLVVLIGPTLA
jgi:hypothetical protein